VTQALRAILLFIASGIAAADIADPDPARFDEAIQAFVDWDSKNALPENSILFVGSSSVRLWSTAKAFPGEPIINRGFGGSELSDVIHFYEQVVRPYSPRKIFLYAGDNDIANGKSAEQVFEDYKTFVAMVREDFPDTELVFISIKPSKDRWEKWPVMVAANRMVRDYAADRPGLAYADLAGPLLGSDGLPKDVYADDDLHLNEEGYRLWQEALAPLVSATVSAAEDTGSEYLEALFLADQDIRSAEMMAEGKFPTLQEERERRIEVFKLISRSKLQTANDFLHAGVILHHTSSISDDNDQLHSLGAENHLLAFFLFERAAALGSENARNLTAAAYNYYLRACGQDADKFGYDFVDKQPVWRPGLSSAESEEVLCGFDPRPYLNQDRGPTAAVPQ